MYLTIAEMLPQDKGISVSLSFPFILRGFHGDSFVPFQVITPAIAPTFTGRPIGAYLSKVFFFFISERLFRTTKDVNNMSNLNNRHRLGSGSAEKNGPLVVEWRT
jgi:hypothetical protein